MGQNLTEYFVKYELYPHPDTRCPLPSILFRPHEYSLYAPLDTFCLWSPRKPRSNIPAMLTAYTHSRTTHVSVYSTMQTIGWGLQKWLSVCEQVSERFGFIVETRGLTCCKMVACVSKHVFFFTVLSMFTGFVSKSRKNSLFLWCVACWTQQKYNDNTV